MLREEVDDFRCSGDEILRQQRKRYLPDDDQKGDAMSNDCCKLVGLVADSSVVSDGDPSALSDGLQPLLVGTSWREMVLMPLNTQFSRCENVGKPGAKIAVGEEDKTHAARSYRTACSISASLKP